jgi:hypothetical protein
MTEIKTHPANITGQTTEHVIGDHVARMSCEHKPSELAPEASTGTVDLMIWGEMNMWRDNAADLELTGLTVSEADEMLTRLIETLTAQREGLRSIPQ